jgi:hypothetical protein
MHSASRRQVRPGRLPGEAALMCRPILTSAPPERKSRAAGYHFCLKRECGGMS